MPSQAVMYGRLPTMQEINQIIEKDLDIVAAEAKAILEEITQGWKNKPVFTIVKKPLARDIVTDSDIFTYVDEGTKPHEIRSRAGKVLVFSVGGSAKTRPNVLGSGSGAKGNTIVRAKVVHHPGNAARNFSVNVAALAEAKLEMLVEKDVQALIDELEDTAIVLS